MDVTIERSWDRVCGRHARGSERLRFNGESGIGAHLAVGHFLYDAPIGIALLRSGLIGRRAN